MLMYSRLRMTSEILFDIIVGERRLALYEGTPSEYKEFADSEINILTIAMILVQFLAIPR